MMWKHERRLVFATSEKWSGWFCERCCWNRRLPSLLKERDPLASRIQAEFDTHDCEVFARENWPLPNPALQR
jgi:hypothetical protein